MQAKEDTPETVEEPGVAQDASRCPGAGRTQGCVLCGDKGKCIFCIAKQGARVEEAMEEWAAVEETGLGCENKEEAAERAAGEKLELEAVPEDNAIGGRESSGGE